MVDCFGKWIVCREQFVWWVLCLFQEVVVLVEGVKAAMVTNFVALKMRLNLCVYKVCYFWVWIGERNGNERKKESILVAERERESLWSIYRGKCREGGPFLTCRRIPRVTFVERELRIGNKRVGGPKQTGVNVSSRTHNRTKTNHTWYFSHSYNRIGTDQIWHFVFSNFNTIYYFRLLPFLLFFCSGSLLICPFLYDKWLSFIFN